ncbi:MAG TPA: hypothetical protein V6C85_33380 [Allocoleopsis sp.]
MNTSDPKPQRFLRPMALLLSVILGVPFFASCSSQQSSAPPPPVDNSRAGGGTLNNSAPAPQAKKKGLSTGQKAAITLAGAAALYYLYKHHQNKQKEGAQGKYYLSKNGRVYYRDEQHRVHWVTPPSGGIQVPAEEAQQYRDFQGYNNSSTGRDLTGLGSAPVPAQ